MSGTDDNLGARIRAARGYAKLGQDALAKLIGVGREVVIAMEADQREPTVREARQISDATGAPLTFLLSGWAAPPELLERVATLEAEVGQARADRDLQAAEIEALSARLERRFAELAGRTPPTDTRHGREDSPRREEDPPAP